MKRKRISNPRCRHDWRVVGKKWLDPEHRKEMWRCAKCAGGNEVIRIIS